ncbi:MAG TPA: YfiR family protein [Bryocella sp.]|nr:YfiR family protein [Bryocella sp.]
MLTARSHLVRCVRLLSPVLLVCFVSCAFGRSVSAAAQPSQSDVEAVYLFDFGKFVRWPEGVDQGPLRICIAGSDSFATALQKTVTNETIGNRPLTVRLLMHPGDEADCAILFIEATEHAHLDELLQAVATRPTLTVSDAPDFLNHGGMIQFQLVEKRVRFSVSLNAVNRAHLAMSSELLKVALSVKGKMPEGGAQ